MRTQGDGSVPRDIKRYGSTGSELVTIAFYVDDITQLGEIRPGDVVTGNLYVLYNGDGEYAVEFSN